VAVGGKRRDITAPDRTPASVPLKLSVTNDFSPGIKGFVERWASLATGMGITARNAVSKPATLRYPDEKLTLSPR